MPEVSEASGPPVLAFDEVAVRPAPGAPVILNALTFAVPPGSMVCLRGRSGTGKSSVARIAAAFTEPDSGAVRWNGALVAGLTETERHSWRATHLGYLDQESGMLPELTLGENVLLRGRAMAIPDAAGRLEELFDALELTGLTRRFPHQVSVGQRQRAAFARALLTDPTLLVLDEPTSAMDEEGATLTLHALEEARDRGAAILLTSHDPLVWERADAIVALHTPGPRHAAGFGGRSPSDVPEF